MKKKNKIDSKKSVKQANDVYQKALNETIELLKNCKNGKYIGSAEDSFEAVNYDDEETIWIIGVGLNDKNHICIIKSPLEYWDWFHYQNWIEIVSDNEIYPWAYPELYRFVAENIDSATTKLKASMIADEYDGGILFNNKEEYEDEKGFNESFNGCTQEFLDEHNITLEEYGEIMYKKGNNLCFNCWNCEHCYECVNCNDCKNCRGCDNCLDCKDCHGIKDGKNPENEGEPDEE